LQRLTKERHRLRNEKLSYVPWIPEDETGTRARPSRNLCQSANVQENVKITRTASLVHNCALSGCQRLNQCKWRRDVLRPNLFELKQIDEDDLWHSELWSVEIDIFQIFVKALETCVNVAVTEANPGAISLRAKKVWLGDLLLECSAFQVDSVSANSGRT
jgi:hypothetical protein